MTWINVKDRKPPRDSSYLVAIGPMADGEYFIRIAWYNPNEDPDMYDRWSCLPTALLEYITHWMELPEPPRDQ